VGRAGGVGGDKRGDREEGEEDVGMVGEGCAEVRLERVDVGSESDRKGPRLVSLRMDRIRSKQCVLLLMDLRL
jgi:hypothetical protein